MQDELSCLQLWHQIVVKLLGLILPRRPPTEMTASPGQGSSSTGRSSSSASTSLSSSLQFYCQNSKLRYHNCVSHSSQFIIVETSCAAMAGADSADVDRWPSLIFHRVERLLLRLWHTVPIRMWLWFWHRWRVEKLEKNTDHPRALLDIF